MQFSELWLRSFVSPDLDSDQLGHLLTMAGLEVEEQDGVAAVFSKVVVAQIVEAEKHPNADKLRVCKVDAGQGELLQIVCGARNAAAGIKIPCALVGADLAGFGIKAAKPSICLQWIISPCRRAICSRTRQPAPRRKIITVFCSMNSHTGRARSIALTA